MHLFSRALPLLATLTVALLSPIAEAVVVINVSQVEDEVVFSYSGSMNFTGDLKSSAGYTGASKFTPSAGTLALAGFQQGQFAYIDTYTAPASSLIPFGSGGEVSSVVLTSGSLFRIVPYGVSGTTFQVMTNYSFGSPISGTAIFTGTYASLGITAGTYTINTASDSMILNITAVPEPGACALTTVLLLSAGTVFHRRLRLRLPFRRPQGETDRRLEESASVSSRPS
ncbi:MAG: hypothetical protein AB7J34_00915 [Limisphaerales bacterium]